METGRNSTKRYEFIENILAAAADFAYMFFAIHLPLTRSPFFPVSERLVNMSHPTHTHAGNDKNERYLLVQLDEKM